MHLNLRQGLAGDRRGVAAVEFALLLPVLMLLYFGVIELAQGFMAQQRAGHTAASIADLVAQSSSVTSAEVGDIFSVGDTVMSPYPTTTLAMRVSSLSADAGGNVTVVWSQGDGITKLAPGTPITGLPANIIQANETVIMAESHYTYTSVFQAVMPSPVVFNNTAYSHPEQSSAVTCADC